MNSSKRLSVMDPDRGYRIRMPSGQWQPISSDAIGHLAYDGAIQPDDLVEFRLDGKWTQFEARQLPVVPYREMLAYHLRAVSAFLADVGNFSNSVASVVADGNRIRRWVDSGGAPITSGGYQAPCDSVSLEIGAESEEATWFSTQIDLVAAVIWQYVGAANAAEPIFQWITSHHPETVGRELWFCAKHQLACLQIARGREIGLKSLCQMIEMGAEDPHFCSGPTFYSFSEVLRFFQVHSRPNPLVTQLLNKHNQAARRSPGESAASNAGSDVAEGPEQALADGADWRTLYEAAELDFRARAKQIGLGQPFDLSVLWPDVPAIWEDGLARSDSPERQPIVCGILTVLGAQDIEEDFGIADAEVHARRVRIQSQLARARTFRNGGSLEEAAAILDQVADTVRDDKTFATLAAEVTRERNEIAKCIAARIEVDATRADSEFFHAADNISQQDDLDRADARLVQLARDKKAHHWRSVLNAIRERMQAKREATRRQSLDAIHLEFVERLGVNQFDAAELSLAKMAEAGADPELINDQAALLRRRHASKFFRDGLDLLDKDPDEAEAQFIAAAQKDAMYEKLAPPLALASRLFHEGIHCPVETMENIQEYQAELYRRAASLVSFVERFHDASEQIWNLLDRFVKNAVSVGDFDNRAVGQLCRSIRSGVRRHRAVPEAIARAIGLLDIIQEHVPRMSEICSPVSTARVELQVWKAIGEGERNQASGSIEEARKYFQKAVKLGPRSNQAWHKLVDCLVSMKDQPWSWKQRNVARLCGMLKQEDREQLCNQASEWIDSHLEREAVSSSSESDENTS